LLKRGNKSCPELLGRVCGERELRRKGWAIVADLFIDESAHTHAQKSRSAGAALSKIYARVLLEKARAPPRPFSFFPLSLILQQILSGRRAA
jgi:hypothetical protein